MPALRHIDALLGTTWAWDDDDDDEHDGRQADDDRDGALRPALAGPEPG